MTEQLEEFLKSIAVNEEKGETGCRRINITRNSGLDAYNISDFDQSYDDGYVGDYSSRDYYIRKKDFEPALQELREKGSVKLCHAAIDSFSSTRYDHTYGEDNNSRVSVSKVILGGRIKLKDSKLDISELSSEEISSLVDFDYYTYDIGEKVKAAIKQGLEDVRL